LGAVAWDVEVRPSWTNKDEHGMTAEITLNEEAHSHYVHRKANMLPIYRMRDELNKFIETCEQAFKDVEEENKGE
jgi:hypothetical protein